MRDLIGRICAAYYFIRTLGRLRGTSFILRSPSLLRVARGGHVWIGRGALIERGSRIVVRSTLVIGDKAYLGKNSTVIAFADVRIGERSLLGENVSIHSEDHGPAGHRLEYTFAPVTIGEDSWLGAGVVVTKGCVIGNEVTIGANAVVTKDIPDGVIAVGVPARIIKPSRSQGGSTP
jgi:acetyltransferase-like isoleucine patch superfamily enzyme